MENKYYAIFETVDPISKNSIQGVFNYFHRNEEINIQILSSKNLGNNILYRYLCKIDMDINSIKDISGVGHFEDECYTANLCQLSRIKFLFSIKTQNLINRLLKIYNTSQLIS